MKTKSEQAKIIGFTFLLISLLMLSAWVQLKFFAFKAGNNLLVEAYIFNGAFGLLSYVLLLVMNRKNPGLTGFVFMAGSALKFVFFFLIFYPIYYADGSISRIEFASFFVPYALCLTAELIYFVKY